MEPLPETEQELLGAAEAVVDAAAWCHFIRIGETLTPRVRAVLVRAVLEDPTLTKALFDAGVLEIQ